METTSSGIILLACGVVPVAAIVPVYRLEHTGTIEEPLLYQVKVKRSSYHLLCFLQHTLSVLVAEIGKIIISCDTHRSSLLLKLVIPNNTTPSHGIIYHPTSKIQYLGKSRPTLLALQYSKKKQTWQTQRKGSVKYLYQITRTSYRRRNGGKVVLKFGDQVLGKRHVDRIGMSCLGQSIRFLGGHELHTMRDRSGRTQRNERENENEATLKSFFVVAACLTKSLSTTAPTLWRQTFNAVGRSDIMRVMTCVLQGRYTNGVYMICMV